MIEFKYTADQIVNNYRFRCLEKRLILKKQAWSASAIILSGQKEKLPEHRRELNPTITTKQKKYYALIREPEKIIRSKEKLSNSSSNIIISKHETREIN